MILEVLVLVALAQEPAKPPAKPATQEPPPKKPAPPPPPPPKKEDPMSMDRSVRPILQRHCYRCHNPERQKGGVNLAKDENPRLIAENRKTWQVALDMVERKIMPPEDATQPNEEQRKQLADFIRKTLNTLDCEKIREPGKPVVRRLNRVEYDQSILDLTGLDLKLAADFSPDANAHGFDNNAEALAMSPVLVEQYHAAARKLLAALGKDAAAKSRILGSGADRAAARLAIERFATRAFRRPAEPDFLEKLLGLYDKARARGDAHERAVEPMLLAVLLSPRFLLRIESHKPDEKGSYAVDDHDLASRLSFFLWSGPPDDVLLAAAAKGELRTADQAEAQARRMLAHPRGRALAEHFVGQWLQLRNLAAHKPDAKVFPEFSESLRASMKRELDLFLDEVIRKDRPLTELLDADYSYLNEELAKHYGIPGVAGPEHRRVALPDRRRGGLLTSGTVLMVQSDPDRTNIPRRGNYIAGSILGMPPPPPPPDVPPLEETKATATVVTLRQRFELHRSKPDCAGCHVKIDPLGFAFENYDALGRWREKDEGAPVDASGVLPNGKAFRGPAELKAILVARREEFTRTLAENLLIYALGRSLQLEDECVVRDAVKAAAANDYKFSAVVYAIVRSHPFRHRRNPEY